MNAQEWVVPWVLYHNLDTMEDTASADCPNCGQKTTIPYKELWKRKGIHNNPIAQCQCGTLLYFEPEWPTLDIYFEDALPDGTDSYCGDKRFQGAVR